MSRARERFDLVGDERLAGDDEQRLRQVVDNGRIRSPRPAARIIAVAASSAQNV